MSLATAGSGSIGAQSVGVELARRCSSRRCGAGCRNSRSGLTEHGGCRGGAPLRILPARLSRGIPLRRRGGLEESKNA
ncbi:MAG: hypothetical protein LM559_03615 [Pyrobaculum sp.]|nr:hypothetical protein [Pyrobaculum sp.]